MALGACMEGVCMAGEHAWHGGMHGRGHAWHFGVHGRGHAWQGRYFEIRSMSGWYASYWNAFLLLKICIHTAKLESYLVMNNKRLDILPAYGMFTLTVTDTKTDKMGREHNGTLCWYLSPYSHFYWFLYRSRCKHTIRAVYAKHQHQCSDDASCAALIENNGVTPK